MIAFRRGRAGVAPMAVGIALLLGGLGSTAPAQPAKTAKKDADPTKVPVPLPTADQAELSGNFYRSPTSSRDTPCVIIVHDRGKDSSRVECEELARTLQRGGYAVLTFDLRGHGKSLSVSSGFWNPQFANLRSGFRGTGLAKTTSIAAADFKPNYWPWLVHDLAAARRYLDQRNDAGELNSGSIIVIGVGEGANLGMLWVATEFERSYLTGFVPLKSQGTPRLGGDDIAGCVWVSAVSRPKEGGVYNFDSWLRNVQGLRDKVPMGFVYGGNDAAAKRDAELWMRTLKHVGGGRENPKPNRLIEIKGTELSGHNLLASSSFDVPAKILAYCDDIMKARKAVVWEKKEPDTNPVQLVNVSRFGFRLP